MGIESDSLIDNWLNGIESQQTKMLYQRAVKKYVEFTKRSPEQLIDEAVEDINRQPTKRQHIVRNRIVEFHKYLLSEAEKTGLAGRNKTRITGKGFSMGSARTYIASVQAFYAFYDVKVKAKIRKGQVENERLILTQDQVKKFYDSAQTLRDKALVMFFYQTGCDATTVAGLKYNRVMYGLENNEEPLKISLVRQKTDVKYYTFLGAEGIYALRNYLTELSSKGVVLSPDDYLFVQRSYRGKVYGLKVASIQRIFKILAKRVGLYNGNFNIAGTHAFRETFGSTLWNNGVDSNKVNFLLGHSRGEINKVYLKEEAESLRRSYKNAEKYISIGLLGHPAIIDRSEVDKLKSENEMVWELVKNLSNRLELIEGAKQEEKEHWENYNKAIEDQVKTKKDKKGGNKS